MAQKFKLGQFQLVYMSFERLFSLYVLLCGTYDVAWHHSSRVASGRFVAESRKVQPLVLEHQKRPWAIGTNAWFCNLCHEVFFLFCFCTHLSVEPQVAISSWLCTNCLRWSSYDWHLLDWLSILISTGQSLQNLRTLHNNYLIQST